MGSELLLKLIVLPPRIAMASVTIGLVPRQPAAAEHIFPARLSFGLRTHRRLRPLDPVRPVLFYGDVASLWQAVLAYAVVPF